MNKLATSGIVIITLVSIIARSVVAAFDLLACLLEGKGNIIDTSFFHHLTYIHTASLFFIDGVGLIHMHGTRQ